MAYDLKRTHASTSLNRATAAGTTVAQEGLLLCAVLEDGVEKAKLVAAPAGTEKVMGFAKTADSLPDKTSAVETVTVPASGALIADLRNANLVSGRTRVVVVSTGQVLTVDEVFAGVPADNTVKIDLVSGQMKFHTDEAGEAISVTYTYSLTLDQAKQKFGERFINNRGLHEIFGQIEVGSGNGELYTDQFDTSQDYTSAAALTLGANGSVTKGGAGPALSALVVSVPSEDNPMLGIRFDFDV